MATMARTARSPAVALTVAAAGGVAFGLASTVLSIFHHPFLNTFLLNSIRQLMLKRSLPYMITFTSGDHLGIACEMVGAASGVDVGRRNVFF
jgi:hypothetical protein